MKIKELNLPRNIDKLIQCKPNSEDIVFTHGDYCLPNIIIDNEGNIGFIDLGRSGNADKYQDIALAIRSIKYNLQNDKWVRLFVNTYGIETIDNNKLEYYILLDEFF